MQVKVRPLEEMDAYTSVKWRNDSEVFKYTGNTYKNEITIENELEWIGRAIANNKLGKDYRCAILVDGEYVGNIYLTDINGNSAHYHIFIGNKDYWGKGVAKIASEIILYYAFQELRLDYVVLRVRKENVRAYSLYKKIGFIDVAENEGWVSMIYKKLFSFY